ncbi:MAG: Hsp20/alpha crystallin family protein [Niabella sp.]
MLHRNCHTNEQRQRLHRFLHDDRFAHSQKNFRRPKYNVPVNIEDKKDHYELIVFAVGFSKENIRLSVKEDILYVTGTKAVDENYKPAFVKQEFPVRSFERSLNLNGKVDAEKISAKQENGILYITLPKTEEAKNSSKEIVVE